jgi:L-histidine N-alpha-methyltransferase
MSGARVANPERRTELVRGFEDADATLEFARSVAVALSDHPKWLPCRYLYDTHGSRLFEQICETPEYYLTRTEATLLDASAAAISELTGDRTLVELGAGNARKTERILAAYTGAYGTAQYVPVDISGEALVQTADALAARYPGVPSADCTARTNRVPAPGALSPLMLLFLGSTLGNLNRPRRLRLEQGAVRADPGDFVLLGVDPEDAGSSMPRITMPRNGPPHSPRTSSRA